MGKPQAHLSGALFGAVLCLNIFPLDLIQSGIATVMRMQQIILEESKFAPIGQSSVYAQPEPHDIGEGTLEPC